MGICLQKLDNEFFFKMSPTQNEQLETENDIYEPPGDSMDMEYSDDGGDSREDDLLSLDGNPPSIVSISLFLLKYR